MASGTSFQQLFEQQYEPLCRYAYTFLHDEHTCEDVVQDTFVKIWETKSELIDTPAIRYYLFTAVRNNCISYLRKQKTSGTVYTDETPEPEPEPSLPESHLRSLEDEQSRRIAEALNQLPPKCREVFLLVKWQGLSYKDAAAALDISVKTVENQMGKAIKTFRDWVPTVLQILFFSLSLINQQLS
jgi:RNA polymerase sigma-70 factor (ECF subfamily)